MTHTQFEVIKEVVRIKQEVREVSRERIQLSSPSSVAEILYEYIGEDDREIFAVICLDTKMKVTAIHRASIGSISSAIIAPSEIFKVALLNNASRIIVGHNHPSGNVTESPEDVKVVKRLVEVGNILGIEVLDHLIVTYEENHYNSFKENGLM